MRPLILLKFHFASLWNWRTSYLARFIEPIAYLLFMANGLRGALDDPTSGYGAFFLAGMVCLLSFRAATSGMSDVANDRKWGVFAIYTMQGGSVLGYIASVLLFSLTVFLGQFLVIALCAYLVFGSAALDLCSLLALAGLGVLLVVGWTGFGSAVGGKVDSYARRDLIVTVTTLPVVFAAPLFYPITRETGWLFYLAGANPLTYQVGVLREPSVLGIAGVMAWAVAGVAIGFIALRHSERVSRER